ncbi:MAG: hypothetical protein JWQ84_1969, partial [Mucilaginibacter sp.]|nr:hypothetical protein [Mucilaginibacter sp.]
MLFKTSFISPHNGLYFKARGYQIN